MENTPRRFAHNGALLDYQKKCTSERFVWNQSVCFNSRFGIMKTWQKKLQKGASDGPFLHLLSLSQRSFLRYCSYPSPVILTAYVSHLRQWAQVVPCNCCTDIVLFLSAFPHKSHSFIFCPSSEILVTVFDRLWQLSFCWKYQWHRTKLPSIWPPVVRPYHRNYWKSCGCRTNNLVASTH